MIQDSFKFNLKIHSKENMLNLVSQYYLNKLYRSAQLNRDQLIRKQEQNWSHIRAYLKGTKLSNDFNLQNFNTYSDLRNYGPILSYENLSPYIDQTLKLEKNIMTPDLPVRVGLTSGTTGKHGKKIPINQPMLNQFNWSRRYILSSILNEFRIDSIKKIKSLSLSAQAEVYIENGLSYGYISGIINQYIPYPLHNNFYPQKELPSPDQWDKRILALDLEIKGVELQIVAGIPAVILETLESLCQHYGVSSLNTIFPQIKYCVFGGTDISLYRKRLNEVCGRELHYFGSYVASEAPIGLPIASTKEIASYLLNPNIIVGFESLIKPRKIEGVGEVKVGDCYRILLTMPNGFIQYPLMDEIEILSTEPIFSFKIIGRKGGGLNLATEKIDEARLSKVIQSFSDLNLVKVFGYTVAPYFDSKNPSYEIFLFIGSTENKYNELLDSKELLGSYARTIDEIMMKQNQDYKESRNAGVIKPLQLKVLPQEALVNYIRLNAEAGQVKIPTVFRERNNLLQFFQNKLKLNTDQLGILP